MIDLNGMSRAALETAKRREEKGQLKSDTFSILKHCAGEVCETVEAYYWAYATRSLTDKKSYADELADIITCVLIVGAEEHIDMEPAIRQIEEQIGKGEEREEG